MQYTNRDAYLTITLPDVLGHHQSLDYVTVWLKAPQATAFAEVTTGLDLVHVESTLYQLKLPANLLTTFGDFRIRVDMYEDTLKTTFSSAVYDRFDVAESTASPALPADTCLLVGNVKDVAGRPPSWQGIDVSYRPYTFPQVHQSAAITSEFVRTVTNIDGYFEMPVIRGTKIVFEIPRCGVRCQYDVPYDQDVINMVDVFNAIITS